MLKLKQKRKKAGQALVEFALTITVLFTFLSAIIDLGLAFFAYQGIKAAAYEGVSYGALFPLTSAGAINTAEIRTRLRYENGADPDSLPLPGQQSTAGAGFVNLFDLNNDDQPDNIDVLDDRIRITFIRGVVPSSAPIDCANPATMMRQFCDISIRLQYTYKPFFAFASLLGAKKIELVTTQQQTIP